MILYGDLPERCYYKNNNQIKKLSELLKGLGLIKRRYKHISDEMLNVLNNNIDNQIKEHINIIALKKGILYMEVDSHSWLHHLANFYKQELLDIFQRHVKSTFISDIKFRLATPVFDRKG